MLIIQIHKNTNNINGNDNIMNRCIKQDTNNKHILKIY